MNKDEWIEEMMNELFLGVNKDEGMLEDIFEDVCNEIGVDKSDYHYYLESGSIVVQLLV